ncbi:MAG: bifunctional phosphopantothenoylcysteine decarboxylase/phosphopantothenate--cysteine ligase CoaBC [Alphaproteobacteria bacterium]
MDLAGKRILLIIGGGIAAFKSVDLVRRLQERRAKVRVVLTPAARHFVTPLTLGALTADKVYTDLFDLTDEAEMGHIELSRDADLLVVAPATADLMARMASGMADDLASTALLATDKRVLIAPAMNVRMWDHPATQRNLATLTTDGILVVGPGHGDMACGEHGPGRMAEPLEIVAGIENALAPARAPLAGRHVLVTAGPTHEPIDPVRYIANRSSGKQGYAIASSLAAAGARVTLVSGPTTLSDPQGVRIIRVETAREMLAACEAALPADAAIFTAAVADWRTAGMADQKLKKVEGGGLPRLDLAENPDILATVSRHPTRRPRLVIGFAAETDQVLEHARAKRLRKGCDWLIANDVSPGTGVMGGDTNTIHLLTDHGVESWPTLSKTAVADRLTGAIAAALGADARALEETP